MRKAFRTLILIMMAIVFIASLTACNGGGIINSKKGSKVTAATVGENHTLKFSNNPTEENYTFTNNTALNSADDITTYSVTYELDGGKNSADNPSEYSIETLGVEDKIIKLSDPSKVTVTKTTYVPLGNGQYEDTVVTDGYTFLGWYTDSSFTNKVTELSASLGSVTLYAKWSDSTETTTITTSPTYQRVVRQKGPVTNEDYFLFGTYPQSEVNDLDLINALSTAAGTTSSWTSYEYYINNNTSNYMRHKDITHTDGNKYRGIYFTSYRPYWATSSSSEDSTYQDDNGYRTSTIYWFKFTPIKWNVVPKEETETEETETEETETEETETEETVTEENLTLLSELILDSQQYDYDGNYENNYEKSTIRAWLNKAFYNTAFTESQKKIIAETSVDNSPASMDERSNQYASQKNTDDHLFLISVHEAKSWIKNNLDRKRLSTDYAKSQGLWQDKKLIGEECYSYYWLRSPFYDYNYFVRFVYSDGNIYNYRNVCRTDCGVLPALTIKLAKRHNNP